MHQHLLLCNWGGAVLTNTAGQRTGEEFAFSWEPFIMTGRESTANFSKGIKLCKKFFLKNGENQVTILFFAYEWQCVISLPIKQSVTCRKGSGFLLCGFIRCPDPIRCFFPNSYINNEVICSLNSIVHQVFSERLIFKDYLKGSIPMQI